METSTFRAAGVLLGVLAVALVIGLPVAVWLDLRAITSGTIAHEAADLDLVFTNIRRFYTSDVVSRVNANHGKALVVANYRRHPGGIPLPSAFSLELAHVVGDPQQSLAYRFVSEYPFRGRAPHRLDGFERASLAAFRQNPHQTLTQESWRGVNSQVRYVTPIVMQQTCVTCHNLNPDSPKHDWRVGDVGGIQELAITQPIVRNLGGFKYLLVYLALLVAAGAGTILLLRREALAVARNNRFLSTVASKIAKYLSPQIVKSIFSGRTDAAIQTTRKKLTIFFSDIVEFTSSSERFQPEDLTQLLNEYFTAMYEIALSRGGTIDKFIGDALLIFFGDPETKGEAEDARAAVLMAIEMQRRLGELHLQWRQRGIEQPFRVRMGMNTGFCNVGNFGSTERMDYTIIGAAVNVASRLQSIAEPGKIVLSFETYALVRNTVKARALDPVHVKGVAHAIVPYVVEGLIEAGALRSVISEHSDGFSLHVDVDAVADRSWAREVLRKVIDALEK